MKRIFLLSATVLLLGVMSCTPTEVKKAMGTVLEGMEEGGGISNQEIGMGLKEALTQGITKGVNITSKKDGFFKNPQIKIPWPEEVQKVEKTLRDIGLGGQVDKVVMSLNRAAEDAAVKAKPIFINAIKQLTFQDVMSILKGNDNAATDFLRRTTSNQLRTEFKPPIKTSLNKVNATKYWGDVINSYNKVPLVKKVNPDLTGYVTDKALDGLFLMVSKEEKKIRKNPIARGTELLKKVFALQDNK